MTTTITSLHHVTATVGYAQTDLDFFTKLLGLRLVKRTVNFDNPGVYHFYYGDAHGSPGSIFTTFPYAGLGVRKGEIGAGQVTVTSFAVPQGALDFWRTRLTEQGVTIRETNPRFGEKVLSFIDPSGLVLEIIESHGDRPASWIARDLDGHTAIQGIHSVTLEIRDPAPTFELLQNVLGLTLIGKEEHRIRLRAGEGDAGHTLDVLQVPDATAGVNGIGTVHHLALAIRTEVEQQSLQEQLRRLGYNVTDVRDRQYFRSIYFREPGGVLLEVATEGPGFLIDEGEDELGYNLKLPPWEEHRRGAIETALPSIQY